MSSTTAITPDFLQKLRDGEIPNPYVAALPAPPRTSDQQDFFPWRVTDAEIREVHKRNGHVVRNERARLTCYVSRQSDKSLVELRPLVPHEEITEPHFVVLLRGVGAISLDPAEQYTRTHLLVLYLTLQRRMRDENPDWPDPDRPASFLLAPLAEDVERAIVLVEQHLAAEEVAQDAGAPWFFSARSVPGAEWAAYRSYQPSFHVPPWCDLMPVPDPPSNTASGFYHWEAVRQDECEPWLIPTQHTRVWTQFKRGVDSPGVETTTESEPGPLPTRVLPLNFLAVAYFFYMHTYRSLNTSHPLQRDHSAQEPDPPPLATPALARLMRLLDYFLSLLETGTPSEWRGLPDRPEWLPESPTQHCMNNAGRDFGVLEMRPSGPGASTPPLPAEATRTSNDANSLQHNASLPGSAHFDAIQPEKDYTLEERAALQQLCADLAAELHAVAPGRMSAALRQLRHTLQGEAGEGTNLATLAKFRQLFDKIDYRQYREARVEEHRLEWEYEVAEGLHDLLDVPNFDYNSDEEETGDEEYAAVEDGVTDDEGVDVQSVAPDDE